MGVGEVPTSEWFGEASARSSERLMRVLPGGNTRTATHFAPFPLVLARGDGCRLWDVDGREYLDFLNNYTALVHGHAAPFIVRAIEEQLPRGSVFAAPIELQADLAERICARFGSIERVRYTNSGTEAVMMAVRAARAFTDRNVIVKAIGGYHGSWEQVAISSAEDPDALGGRANPHERGIPSVIKSLVREVRFNDVEHLESVMAEHGRDAAAILLEPVLGHRIIPGSREFLGSAERLATRYGALLILDEVVTARLHVGGIQTMYGIRPDLTALGKVIGGGLPVGAFGGRADIMDLFDPRRADYVDHHGTFNGNALTMAAGCASLDALTEGEIARINALGETLAKGVEEVFRAADLPVRTTSIGSLLNLHADPELLGEVHKAALAERLNIAPRGLMNVSTPMGGEEIAEAVGGIRRVAERLAPLAQRTRAEVKAP